MRVNLADYEVIDDITSDFKPEIGDIVFHPHRHGQICEGTVEIIVSENTDLIQEEFYRSLKLGKTYPSTKFDKPTQLSAVIRRKSLMD